MSMLYYKKKYFKKNYHTRESYILQSLDESPLDGHLKFKQYPLKRELLTGKKKIRSIVHY